MNVFYNYSIVAGWVTALILGICLLECKVPSNPVYKTYLRSRRILGVAYLVFAVGISQFTFFNLRVSHPNIAVALPLSYFYLEGILWGMSMSSLLDSGYISRKRIWQLFGPFAIFLVLTWCGALLAEGVLRTALLIIASLWFFIAASFIAYQFFKIYFRARRRINDFYSDNVEGFVIWIHKTVYAIIFLGLSGAILAFSPRFYNAIFMLCGIVLFTYVFISFQNYILNYPMLTPALEESEGEAVSGSADTDAAMRRSIEKWIADKGFAEPGITLEKLALIVGVNRSYVSAFINSEYRCNFRELVNSHRLEYAKRLLKENPKDTIEKVSYDTGFSSATYFSRLFTKQEGLSPSKWRESL